MKFMITIHKDGKPDLKRVIYAGDAKTALKMFWGTTPWRWGENAESLSIKINKV